MVDLSKFTLPLRIAEIVFAIIVLGLIASVADYYNDFGALRVFPDSFAFLLFCGVWGIVIGIILLASTKAGELQYKEYIVTALDIITAIFFFAGFIAVAAQPEARVSCEPVFGFTNDYVTNCRVIKASIAMGAFSWVCWTITSVISALGAIAVSKGSNGSSGGSTTTPS